MGHGLRLAGVFACVCALSGCFEVGNGHRATESRDVSDFDRIDNATDLNVLVEPGDRTEVTVSLDSNLLDRVYTEVEDGELRIRVRGSFVSHLHGENVRVRMPALNEIRVSGDGNLTATDFDDSTTVKINVSGDGDLTWSGMADELDVKVSGSGDATLKGDVGYLDAQVSGDGDLHARGCDAAGARIDVRGDGDAAVTIHGDVEAKVSGDGDLNVYGEPHFTSRSVTGDGTLRIH